MKSFTSHLPVRIYYEDTDCGNVVYYANYLKYMERGRTEFLRELGFDVYDLHKKGTLFVVAEASIKYKKSARLNELLDVVTSVSQISFATIIFHHEIVKQNHDVCVISDIKVACIDSNGKIKRIPQEILNKLNGI
jgi:acyl-CoA thioester hydrolase